MKYLKNSNEVTMYVKKTKSIFLTRFYIVSGFLFYLLHKFFFHFWMISSNFQSIFALLQKNGTFLQVFMNFLVNNLSEHAIVVTFGFDIYFVFFFGFDLMIES